MGFKDAWARARGRNNAGLARRADKYTLQIRAAIEGNQYLRDGRLRKILADAARISPALANRLARVATNTQTQLQQLQQLRQQQQQQQQQQTRRQAYMRASRPNANMSHLTTQMLLRHAPSPLPNNHPDRILLRRLRAL